MLLIYDRLRLQMSSKTSSHITIAMSLSIIPSTSKIYDDYFSHSISDYFFMLYDVWVLMVYLMLRAFNYRKVTLFDKECKTLHKIYILIHTNIRKSEYPWISSWLWNVINYVSISETAVHSMFSAYIDWSNR